MADLLGALGGALAWWPVTQACAPVPPLSYAPATVGWATLALCALDIGAGVACVGVVGNLLRWTADDRAPLRPLWSALIVLGFAASAGGLYVAFANQTHAHAVAAWLMNASRACLETTAKSPNLSASTALVSVQLGGLALALIALGVFGAVVERRRDKQTTA